MHIGQPSEGQASMKDWQDQSRRPQSLCGPCQIPFPPIPLKPILAGRLQFFLPNWKKLTQDPWVLETVAGYQLRFRQEFHQSVAPMMRVSKEEERCISEEVQSLWEKGAISPVPRHREGQCFLSTIFTVPKKDGGRRPIINLKALNRFIPHLHFKMKSIQDLRDKRLYDKVGSNGCLPIDSNLSTPSEVPELHLEPSGLPVHMSPIWAIQCPPDLHKGHETRGGSPQVLGNQTGSVSGRHAVFSSVQGRADPVEEHYPGSLREPGLPDKLPQISSGAIPDHEILRILSEHNYYATLPPQGEGGPDSQRGSEALTIGQCYSEAACSPDRSIHCHLTSMQSFLPHYTIVGSRS